VTSATALTIVRRLLTSTRFSFCIFVVGAAPMVLTTVVIRGSVLRAVFLDTCTPSVAALLILQGLFAIFWTVYRKQIPAALTRHFGVVTRNVDVVLAYIIEIANPKLLGALMQQWFWYRG
jgi:hypothetical protein